ncbi:hypothetical protein EYZ11_005846 [Aspergillus tanneri]|uniref:Uncharacterized protein n=1 Tax=Aspergillus tanneri TaxID=1220188 RepID=A0A4S3JMU5_9EURO|nr:hypothetical protein EYZ11_005846 [Aspergillus tanneri]
MLLVRIMIGKIEDRERLAELLQRVKDDAKALGMSVVE